MFCFKCGTQIPDNAKFCLNCGTEITGSSLQASAASSVDSSFDDELVPIAESTNDPPSKPLDDSSSPTPSAQKKRTTTSRTPDIERAMTENGSGNCWTQYFDGITYDVNVDVENESADGIIRYNAGTRTHILSGYVVDSFQINAKFKRIFFKELRDKKKGLFRLCACDLSGNNLQIVAGDSNDSVNYFAVTDDWVFVVVENKNGLQVIYQISTDLKQARIIKQDVEIKRPIAANNEFLYYVTYSTPKKSSIYELSIIQYDIAAKTEKTIIKNTAISTFQLYRKHLIVSVCKNLFMNADSKLILISPHQMLQKTISNSNVCTFEINCYLEHVFFVDYHKERKYDKSLGESSLENTQYIYALPITGGEPKLVYQGRSQKLNLSYGMLQFLDCEKYKNEKRVTLKILDGLSSNQNRTPEYTGMQIPIPSKTNGRGVPKYIKPPKEDVTPAPTGKSEEKPEKKVVSSNMVKNNPKQVSDPDPLLSKSREELKMQFNQECDREWLKHLPVLILYNAVKCLLTVGGAYACARMLGALFTFKIFQCLFWAAGGIGCALIGFIAVTKLRPREVIMLENKYDKYNVNTYRTPPGIRERLFGFLFIGAFIAFIIL